MLAEESQAGTGWDTCPRWAASKCTERQLSSSGRGFLERPGSPCVGRGCPQRSEKWNLLLFHAHVPTCPQEPSQVSLTCSRGDTGPTSSLCHCYSNQWLSKRGARRAGSASPQLLLAMQSLGPHPGHSEPEALGPEICGIFVFFVCLF